MALWQGVLTHQPIEPAGTGPLRAYFMPDPNGSGRLVIGAGALGEATAFLKADPLASAPNRYTLDDDPAEEDRFPFIVGGRAIV